MALSVVDMRAGALRHRVQIQTPNETRDAYGGVTVAWSTVADVWASIREQAGRESLMSGQNTGELLVEIRFRHIAGVTLTPKYRILHGDTPYGIRAVMNPDVRNRESVCVCTQIAGDSV